MYNMTSKGQVETLTSGQGHDLTQTYHDAYHSIRLDKTSQSNLFWSLYLVSIKSYCEEIVGNLWWRHATSTAHRRGQRCTYQLKWLANTTFYMFWLLRMVMTQTKMKWNFSHWLIMGRSQNRPDLRSKIKKIRDKYFVYLWPKVSSILWPPHYKSMGYISFKLGLRHNRPK